MMHVTKSMIVAVIAGSLLSHGSLAQDSKNQGYLVDTYGNDTVTSPNTGLCWRTSDWTPARAVEACDPIERKAEVPAPRVVAAAPPTALPQKPATPSAMAAAPVRVIPQSIGYSADALFTFDQSMLRPGGKTLLDDFVRQLSDAQYETIVVMGHTDRLGSDAYNQKLSERRANAVKDYLVSKDIPANRMNATGKGKTQPVTGPDDCKGVQSVKVIACLQPDRRVHVEVTGTKAVSKTSR